MKSRLSKVTFELISGHFIVSKLPLPMNIGRGKSVDTRIILLV